MSSDDREEIEQKPLLRLDHVSKTFPMGEVSVEALKEAELVMVGPSGSGKTMGRAFFLK